MGLSAGNKTGSYTLGIDIGGTKCAVVLGKGEIPKDYDPDFILEKRRILTDTAKGWAGVLEELSCLAEEILRVRGIKKEQLAGIGISCGGPLNYKEGVILGPPNLPGWDYVPAVEFFSQRFPCPVHLQNDANACAVAEWKFGAARGKENIVFLTFGTGMGAGLILDGRLYHGTSDLAGEIGHIRLEQQGPEGYGKAGSMEGFCSGGGIARLARMKLKEMGEENLPAAYRHVGEKELTTEFIAGKAGEGDEFSREIFRISARNLGKGLAILIDLLNPEMIVIGSIYERCQELFDQEMYRVLKEEALSGSLADCRIVPAALKDRIGDYGALSVAFGI